MSSRAEQAYDRLIRANVRAWVAVLALVGAFPLAFGFVDGTFHSVPESRGAALRAVCGDSVVGSAFKGLDHAPNWWIYVVVLPLIFILVRTSLRQMLGENGASPPMATLVDPEGRAEVAALLRSRLVSGWTPIVVLTLVLLIAIVDSKDLIRAYTGHACPAERDWSVYWLLEGGPSKLLNGFHVFISYCLQYLLGFGALLLFALALVHNYTYIGRIYQRRRGDDSSRFIVLNFDDAQGFFGQSALLKTFRQQVLYVVMAGAVVSISRYANVDRAMMDDVWAKVMVEVGKKDNFQKIVGLVNGFMSLDWAKLFRDSGQWIQATAFAIAFGIAWIPSIVKFLPFFKSGGWTLTPLEYLCEFLSPVGRTLDDAELKKLSGQFASNSFWPAGDGAAQRLFFLAYIVLMFVLLPIPVHASGDAVGYIVGVAAFSLALTTLSFAAYRWILAYVGPMLVRKPERE